MRTSTSTLTLSYEGHQWIGGLSFCGASLEALQAHASSFLHPNERRVYESLSFPKRQTSFLLGRYCAKQAVTVITPQLPQSSIWIENGVFQQPILHHPLEKHLQVSISHSDTIGAALVFPEACPMAVDIEKMSDLKISTIRSIVTSEEQELLSRHVSEITAQMTMLWTIKEALAKVLRCGLMISLELLELKTCDSQGSTIYSTFKHFPQYQALSFPLNGSICSIAYPKHSVLEITLDAVQDRFIEHTTEVVQQFPLEKLYAFRG